jgi:hypothetical protein
LTPVFTSTSAVQLRWPWGGGGGGRVIVTSVELWDHVPPGTAAADRLRLSMYWHASGRDRT